LLRRWSNSARSGQSARNRCDGFRSVPTNRDTHQLGIAQLLHARHPLVQFSGLIRLHVGVDHLADFGRFAGVTWPYDLYENFVPRLACTMS
jgi:hypothetical protein